MNEVRRYRRYIMLSDDLCLLVGFWTTIVVFTFETNGSCGRVSIVKVGIWACVCNIAQITEDTNR